jgi:hypothetical protein
LELPATPVKTLSFEQLAAARKRTEAVSQFLEKQLRGYLDTLRTLLMPERILGKLAGSRFDVPGVDKVLAELQENYRRLPGKPFEFPKELETDWLSEVGPKLELNRSEYTLEITTESGKRPILITSPNRWTLAYGPGLSVAQAVSAFGRKQDRRAMDQLRQFVVNELVMQALIARSAGLTALLAELRYNVSKQVHPALSGLPLVVIQSQVPTFLPPEPLIAAATGLSGIAAFIELIDVDAVKELADPFKVHISEITAG